MNNSQQRIAVVCFSHSLGGLELSTLRIAARMKSSGAYTMVVVPSSSPLARRASEADLDLAILAPRWKYGDIQTARRLARILKDNKVDIVVLMQSHDIHLASLASYFLPGLKIVFYQQMDSRHNKRDLFHTWIFSKLSLWVTLTHSMRTNVLECTRMADAKVKVVPLGTDLHRFDPSLYSRAGSRLLFGLPHDKKIIGVLGRLDPGKGQEVFLRAIPQVIKDHPETLFVIAGDETAGEPGYKKYLEKISREIGADGNVKFIPFTDDVPRLMAALDIFSLPSFAETYGLVVIEAMAMEKPVIATNAGGVPEILTDGKTGLLVEPRNAGAIAGAIIKFLDNEELRVIFGRAAREAALRQFSMDNCVDALLRLLSAL